jgi:hypothetical protein
MTGDWWRSDDQVNAEDIRVDVDLLWALRIR